MDGDKQVEGVGENVAILISSLAAFGSAGIRM